MTGQLIQDSSRAASIHLAAARPDSITSPLPGGVAEIVRFIFNVPQWIQILGFFVGVAVAIAVVAWLWRRRQQIIQWVITRERGVKIGLAAGVFTLIAAAGTAGTVSWNYMQHDNGFCTGCHVMSQPFGQFQARAGKHDSLECHSCHQQSIFASTRQLVLWVAERPEKIGAHAKVPTARCASCHIEGPEQKEVWQRIATTAGHRTHLESDSTDLRDIQCVTCHGAEVHKFVPSDQTCTQSGCHDQTKITLGGMAEQTSMHCATCHQFTLEVPRLATRDSAAGTLVPTNKQCLSCHEMQRVLETFDPDRDPHSGTCGMCHNPHQQREAPEAAKTCTTAGCHDNWRNEPFHQGVAHRRVGNECITCHQPHAAKVDASDCETCHRNVRENPPARRLTPPLPFDTLRALRRSSTAPEPASSGGPVTGFLGWGWPTPPPIAPAAAAATAPADTFPHPRHRKLPCLTCHTSNIRHGRLTFEAPRGCEICHHQAPKTADCATCHQPDELAKPTQARVTVSVPNKPAKTRTVPFEHQRHQKTACVTCHVTSVSLAPDSATVTCRSCHTDHHRAAAGCASCHAGLERQPAHARATDAHRGCDACHSSATVVDLTPNRAFCLTCHQTQARHYPAKECTVCHFLATPAEYRTHLRQPPRPSR